MALFKRLTKEQIEKDYTHYGFLHGVPIYYNNDGHNVCVRNWCPELLLDIGEFLFGLTVMIFNIENPMYAIKITGKIKPVNEDNTNVQ